MKIPRNGPCACGSGKKYKKCCLAADEEDAPRYVTPSGAELGEAPGSWDEPLEDDLEDDLEADDPHERALDAIEEVKRAMAAEFASLLTEAILGLVEKLGVPLTRERFLEVARGTDSARKAAAALCSPDGPKERAFVGFASCELWKRWCPERPSIEMIRDWVEEGYALARTDSKEICELWQRAWEGLRSRLTPEMTTCQAADELLESDFTFDWTRDFAEELLDAAPEDEGAAERGVVYVREVLAQFTGEAGDYRQGLAGDLGELLFMAGREEEGARVFLDLIRSSPTSAYGYVRLAENLEDKERARALLEEAKAKATDAELWELDDVIEELTART